MVGNQLPVPGSLVLAAITRGAVGVTLSALAPCLALAQDAGNAAHAWIIEPSVALRQTFTDNQTLQSVKESDSITEASAGVRLTGNSRILRGFLDYSLTGSAYAKNSAANALDHVLNANAIAEVIDGQAFVDLRASYLKQAISAFGSQSPEQRLTERNTADFARVFISPYVRGRVGSTTRYEARLSREVARAKGTDLGDAENSAASLHFDGLASGSALGWSADATHDVSNYRAGRRTFDSRARVGLTYAVTNEVKLGLGVGTERTDLVTIDGKSTPTYAAQAEWTPTERTSLSANVEKRFFGPAHVLRFLHRTRNTVWTVSDSRDISDRATQGNAGLGNVYDLFFRQYASVEPDVVKRDVLVRNLLRTSGVDPNAVVVGGFLSSAATLQRMQSASLAIVGVRNTITVLLSSGRNERADKVATVLDDLSTTRAVRERGLSLDWAYRLTPQSSINLTASYRSSDGDLASQQTTLKAVRAAWTSTLGLNSIVNIGARHVIFDSPTTPYDENALFASFRWLF